MTLMDCLDEFSKTEDIAKDYKCDSCKKKGYCTKKTKIYQLPKILVIHLKRFSFASTYKKSKINASVKFPITGLDLTEYTFNTQASQYNLYGISHHSGYMGGGHYTAEIRSEADGNWHNCDDGHVSKLYSEPSSSGSSPYVLFYVRKS